MTTHSPAHSLDNQKTHGAVIRIIYQMSLTLVLFGILRAELPVLSQLHPGALITVGASDLGILVKLVFFGLYFLILLPHSVAFIRHLPSTIGLLLSKNFPLILLYILVLLSAFWSTDSEITLRASLLGLGTTTFIAMYVGREMKASELHALLKWVFGAAVLLAFVIPGTHEKGLASVWGHPNKMGILSSLSAIAWYLNWVRSSREKLLSLIFIALSFLVLIRTNSAGGLLICLLLFSITVYLERKTAFESRFKLDYRAVFLMALTTLTAFASIIVFLILRVGDIVSALGKDLTFTGRTYLWPLVIQAIQQKLYLGYGLGGFWQLWKGNDSPAAVIDPPGAWIPPNAHNGFLDLTLELGLVGLILFIVAYLITLRMAFRYLAVTQATEVILMVILLLLIPVMNLSETELLGSTYTWFYYIAISTRLCSLRVDLPSG